METKKSSYTPGPLEISDGSIWGISQFGARVRLANIVKHSPMNGIDSEANGILYAASPELLEALKATLSAMREARDTWGDGYKPGVNWLKAWDNAKAAIAKVEGRNKGE